MICRSRRKLQKTFRSRVTRLSKILTVEMTMLKLRMPLTHPLHVRYQGLAGLWKPYMLPQDHQRHWLELEMVPNRSCHQ